MKRRLMRGFLSIFGARVARSIIAIVTLPLIVRALGPSAYGDYGFLISTFSLLMILVSSGVTEGTQKFAAENREDGWQRTVVGYYVRLATVLALLGAGGVVVVTSSGVVARLLGDPFTLYFYLLAAFVVTAQFRSLARRTLMAFELERYSEPLRVASKLIWVVVGLGLVWKGLGVAGMLIGNVVASGLVAVVGLGIVFRRIPIGSVFRPLSDEFPRRELLSFNALNVVLVLLTMSLYHVDVVMLRMLVGSEQTGYYKAALAMAEYLWFVPISLQALLLHSTSALWSDGAYDRIDALAAQLTRYTVLFTVLLAVGIAALADRFVPLYFGADFVPVVVPLLWLLPGTVGFATARPIIAISQGHGNLRPLIAATGTAALLNIVLNALLIPRYGMLGAAVATSIGYGSMLAFHAASARYIGFDPLGDLRPGRIAVTTAATAVVVVSLSGLIEGDLVALAIVPPAGLLTHAGVALASGAVDAREVRNLLSSVPVPLPIGS